MKARNLLVLVIVLAVLIGLGTLSSRRARPTKDAGPLPGEALFPGLDVNAVAQLEISSGSATTIVEKAGERWVVRTAHGYPARFEEVVRQVRRIAELKIGQVVRGGTPEDFGLGEGGGTRVRLSDAGGKTLGEAVIGNVRQRSREPGGWSFPDGTYVRSAAGSIILVKDNLSDLPTTGDTWLERQLLDFDAEQVEEIIISGTNFSGTIKKTGDDAYAMDGLAEDEEVNSETFGRIARLFGGMTFQSVVAPEDDAAMNFVELESVSVRLRDGTQYRVALGEAADGGRYARLQATYEPPPPPTLEDVRTSGETNVEEQVLQERLAQRIKEYNEQVDKARRAVESRSALFQAWTYVLTPYTSQEILPYRDRLVRKKPAVEEPAPESKKSAGPPRRRGRKKTVEPVQSEESPPMPPVPPADVPSEESAPSEASEGSNSSATELTQ